MALSKDRDNVYLNIVINQDPISGNEATPAVYNETLTHPVIKDCSKYYASVIRFDIPLAAIPILVIPIINTQNNPNLTPLIFGIKYVGVNYPVNLVYISDSNSIAPTPSAGPIFFTQRQLSDTYYWVYSIFQMVELFNNTINQAMINAGLGATPSPIFSYNPVSQLFSLTVTQAFLLTGAELYHNDQANNFLSSFRVYYNGNNRPDGDEYIHILSPLPHDAPVGGPYTFIEDYNTIDLWFSLRKIILTTNTIPISPEFVPTQNPFGINTGVSSSLPIICDFVPNLEYSNQGRGIAYYNPQSQYHLVDMISEIPLSRININIFWQDKFGNLYPLLIPSFQQASIKLAFINKNLYYGGNPR